MRLAPYGGQAPILERPVIGRILTQVATSSTFPMD